jgi:hypothetical protein
MMVWMRKRVRTRAREGNLTTSTTSKTMMAFDPLGAQSPVGSWEVHVSSFRTGRKPAGHDLVASEMIPLETAPPVDHDNYLASGNTNGSEYDEEEEEEDDLVASESVH